MAEFSDDDLRVIRAMRQARFDASIEAHGVQGACTDFLESACLYASMKAYFENMQVEQAAMATSSAKILTATPRTDK